MKKYCLLTIIIIYLILKSHIVIAPPQPHNVRGTVYNKDGSYATGGIPITINNTISSDFVRTRTNGIGPAIIDASYSASINGSNNDAIIVTAWNSTHYGANTTNLSNTTTYANIALNTTRPSETNVTIITPLNNSIFNITGYFNATARIMIIGGQNGIDCSATITLSDTNVLKLAAGEAATHNLGGINLGSFTLTTWNISGNLSGNANITVQASCTSDDKNFDNLTLYTTYNITIQDIETPIVRLEYPINNSKFTANSDPIIFRYNVSDISAIANCSLIINNRINQTNYTVAKYISQSFSAALTNNTYNWSVNCTDNSTSYNTGSSPFFNLTIIPNIAPTITNMAVDGPIDLALGSTTIVYCNATVGDENNISDIKSINSTLYHSSVQALANDDNNNHYTNSSCRNITTGIYEINLSCSFGIYYYANNGTWVCNISAIDRGDVIGSNTIGTNVNDLLAIDVSPSIIDYGELEAGTNSSSDFKVNITNFGNIDFNITIDGYGGIDGDNLSMNCTKGNISVGYERYSTIENKAYAEMINLSDVATFIGNFTLLQRTNDTTYKNDRNYTYWKMGIPYGANGACTGFVRFIASMT